MGAALSLLHTVGFERQQGGLCLAAAASEDQATIAFEEAVAIVKATPWLEPAVKATESLFYLEHPKSSSEFRAIPARGEVQLGRTPTFVLADELIAWQSRSLWKALRTGLVKTANSLMVVITQAGRGQNSLAYEMLEYARKVRDGTITDPGFLPVLFELDEGADWKDEKLWHIVNPGLALGFPDLAGLRQLARESEARPADRDDLMQFNLNCWLDNSVSPFVDMGVYDGCEIQFEDDAVEDLPCWIAVDMGLTTDLTAVVTVWRDGDKLYVRSQFFCPGDNIHRRADRDRVPYDQWTREGHITATPGNVTDYSAVADHIRDVAANFNVREIVFDPAYAQAVMHPLTEEGLPTATMRQGWITMAPAVKELERAIVSGNFGHDGNPVLRWCFSNVVTETDKAGNRTFSKGKARERIDGAQAAAMAVGRAMSAENQHFIYDSPERADGIRFF